MARAQEEKLICNPRRLQWAVLGTLFCVLFVFADTNQSSLYIMGTLGGSPIQTAYPFAYFAFGNAITIPLALTLGDRVGIKRMIQICLVCFLITIAYSTFSHTFAIFVIVRLLQGCASGPLFILLPRLVNHLVTPEEHERYTRNIIVIFSFGALTGACSGAFVAYFFTWHVMCLLEFLLVSIFTYLLLSSLRHVPHESNPQPFDWIGFIFYFLSISSIGSFIALGQELDWLRSEFLRFCIFVGVVSLLYFLIRTYDHPYPLLPLRLFKNGFLCFALFQTAFLFSIYYASVLLLGIWLHVLIEYSYLWIGITLLIMTATIFATIGLIHYLENMCFMHSLCFGIFFLFLSTLISAHFDVIIDFNRIAFTRILAGVAFPLFLPAIFHLILKHLPKENEFEGLTLYQITRCLGTAIGSVGYITVWQRRESFFHYRLSGFLNVLSPELREFFASLDPYRLTPDQKNAAMELAINQRSNSLALNDTFFCMSMILVVLFASALLFFRYHPESATAPLLKKVKS